MAFCFLPIVVLLLFKAVSQTLSLYKGSSYVARLKWQMQFCVWLLQTAKISLLDVRKIRLLLLLSLEAFPEPSGMSTQDFPRLVLLLSVVGFCSMWSLWSLLHWTHQARSACAQGLRGGGPQAGPGWVLASTQNLPAQRDCACPTVTRSQHHACL